MRSILLVLLAVFTVPAYAEGPKTRLVRGMVVTVLPQGPKTVLVFKRGTPDGVNVGQRWRCTGALEFECKVTEVYEFRSKCIADVDSRVLGSSLSCAFHLPAEHQRFPAKVLDVVPEEDATTFVLDKGHAHGVGFEDRIEVERQRCRVWRVEQERAMCVVTPSWSGDKPTGADVRTAALPRSTPLDKPQVAPPVPPSPPTWPTRGVRESAPPVAFVRARGHGLLASHACVGFTPDEQTAYVLSYTTGVAPLPDETGLVVERLELASGAVTEVARLRPDRVVEATRILTELIAREGLLACHKAVPTERSATPKWGDPKAWVASHAKEDIAFWFEPESQSIYAAMDGGRVVAERVGAATRDITNVWFLPSSPHHVAHADRWLALTVGR